MFGFVIFRRENDKENALPKSSQINSKEKQEKIIVDIDYDKLANAMVKANSKTINEYVRQLKDEEAQQQKQQQEEWDRAFWISRYGGENKAKQILTWIRNVICLFLSLIFFNKRQITGTTGTYILLKTIAVNLIKIYKWILYIFGGGSVYICIRYNYILENLLKDETLISNFCAIGKINFGLIAFAGLFVGRILRVVQIEIDKTTDKDVILSMFNAIVGFSAMILTFIALLIN